MREAYPGRSRASFPWRSPATATPATAGRQAGGRALAAGPLLPPAPPPPAPIPNRFWASSGTLGGCPAPPAHPQPSHRKAQLGFPHPDAIKKFRMWSGEESRRADLEGSECRLEPGLAPQEQGLAAGPVLPRFAQHLGQVS